MLGTSSQNAIRLLVVVAALTLLTPSVRAQWVPTGGPTGSRLYTIAAPTGAFLGANRFVSLRYADGAWAPSPVGTGDLVAGGSSVLARTDSGLVLSLDAGRTVALTAGTQPSWRPLQVDGPHLFALNGDSLHVSADDGATWATVRDDIQVTFGGGQVDTFPVTLNPDGGALMDGGAVLVAGTAYVFGGVYRHAPGDTAWVALFQPGVPMISEGVDPYGLVRYDGALWFGHSGGIHRSADGGATWTDASAGIPATSGVEVYAGAAGLIARSRGSGGFFRWTGAGWSALPPPPEVTSDTAVGDALYAAATSHVYTFDGTAWSALPNVVASSPVPIAAAGASLLVASGSQLLRSTDGAATWTAALNGFSGPTAAAPAGSSPERRPG